LPDAVNDTWEEATVDFDTHLQAAWAGFAGQLQLAGIEIERVESDCWYFYLFATGDLSSVCGENTDTRFELVLLT
jgi:hypothetical protein